MNMKGVSHWLETFSHFLGDITASPKLTSAVANADIFPLHR